MEGKEWQGESRFVEEYLEDDKAVISDKIRTTLINHVVNHGLSLRGLP